MRLRLDERRRRDDLPRRAEPALQRVGAHERVDERMLAEPLDRRDLAAVDRVHERDARQHGHAVELNRARAAVPFAARDLRSGEAEVAAQRVCERAADGRLEAVELAVDGELNQSPEVSARMSARCSRSNVLR